MTPTLVRRAGAVTLVAATMAALAACTGIGARLTFNDTEKAKVTEIAIDGGSGDVVVTTSAAATTSIKRVVEHSADPGPSYRMVGNVLHIETRCGPRCSVSYEIQAPAGVAVTGGLTSGDLGLTGVGRTDVTLHSGDIVVRGATGTVKARSTSGDITVIDAKGGVTLQATSGDVHALNVSGGPVSARTTSGEVEVRALVPTGVTAQATSGDVDVTVPPGKYRLLTSTGSGDTNVTGIINDPTATNVLDVRARSGDVTVAAVG
jgi:Putative adhesin